jgi:raffinose/stachyose/melibiose transport system substrate-binding protein
MSGMLALALAVAVAGAVLGGCGSGGSSSPTAESSSADSSTAESSTAEGTVHILLTSEIQKAMENMGAEFEEANPNAEVEVEIVSAEQLGAVELTRMRSGSPPNLMQAAAGSPDTFGILNYAGQGLVTDLSDQPWAEEIPPVIARTIEMDGKTYGFVTTFGFVAAIYNEDALAELGAQIPTTYKDLLGLCRKATEAGKTAVALGGQESFMNIFPGGALAASTVEPNFKQERVNEETTFAESAGWLESLEMFREMADEGCFGETPTGYGFSAAQKQVATGKALALMGVPTFAVPVQEANPQAKLGMFPLPGAESAEDVRVPVAGTYGMVIPANAEEPEIAKEFLAFLAERDEKFASDASSLPVIGLTSLDEAPLLPGMEPMKPYLSDEKAVEMPTLYWPNDEVQIQWINGIQGMLSGDGTTPEQILESMDKAWSEG